MRAPVDNLRAARWLANRSSARRSRRSTPEFPACGGGWQVRRDSNPQPSVLETDALPIELLTCVVFAAMAFGQRPKPYFDSLCAVCFRQKRQNLLNSSRSVVFFLFFVVL